MNRTLAQTFVQYLLLMRLHRPIGIFLLLWPTLWALWLAADGLPTLHVLAVFVAGTVLMRSAGCAINDFADREIDGQVARTRERPLATGALAPEEAVRLFVAVGLIAFGLLTSLRNVPAILLAIPAVVLAALYPFMKRWIVMPQAILGLAFSWGIPMAYAAVNPAQLPWAEILMLMTANLCWVIAYDTYYAMADREDDRRIGVKSSALWFGRHDRLAIALLQATALILLMQLGALRNLGPAFFTGIAVAAWLSAWQQWMTRTRAPEACIRAFLNNNYFGAAIFIGLAADYALR